MQLQCRLSNSYPAEPKVLTITGQEIVFEYLVRIGQREYIVDKLMYMEHKYTEEVENILTSILESKGKKKNTHEISESLNGLIDQLNSKINQLILQGKIRIDRYTVFFNKMHIELYHLQRPNPEYRKPFASWVSVWDDQSRLILRTIDKKEIHMIEYSNPYTETVIKFVDQTGLPYDVKYGDFRIYIEDGEEHLENIPENNPEIKFLTINDNRRLRFNKILDYVLQKNNEDYKYLLNVVDYCLDIVYTNMEIK